MVAHLHCGSDFCFLLPKSLKYPCFVLLVDGLTGEEKFVFPATRLTNWKVGERYLVRHVSLRSPGLVPCLVFVVDDEEMVGQIFSFCTHSRSVEPHVMVPTFLLVSLSDRNRNQNSSIAPSI